LQRFQPKYSPNDLYLETRYMHVVNLKELMKACRHGVKHGIHAQKALSHQAGIRARFPMINMEQHSISYLEPTEVI
jgi:hypothetical protein